MSINLAGVRSKSEPTILADPVESDVPSPVTQTFPSPKSHSELDCLCKGIRFESEALKLGYKELIKKLQRQSNKLYSDMMSAATMTPVAKSLRDEIQKIKEKLDEEIVSITTAYDKLYIMTFHVTTKEEAMNWVEWYLKTHHEHESIEKSFWQEAFPNGTDRMSSDEVYAIALEQPIIRRIIYRGSILYEQEDAI